MKFRWHALTLILGLGLVAPALAQEEPAKEEAAAPASEDTPAKEEAAAPKAEAAPAAEAEPAKELSSCAKSLAPLADSYKSAYDDMQKWIGQIDTETAAANDKVQKLQAQIHENETATTQAKLDKDNAKVKDLQKANKTLWNDFNAATKAQSDACAKFVKEAPQRVKQYADATNKALGELKAQTK